MNLRYTLIALFLLLVTLLAAISVQGYICNTCQEAADAIADIRLQARCGQFSACVDRLEALTAMFNDRKIVFAIALNHSYLDSILSSLGSATICAQFEDLQSLEAELASAAFAVNSLAARDRPTLGNIF